MADLEYTATIQLDPTSLEVVLLQIVKHMEKVGVAGKKAGTVTEDALEKAAKAGTKSANKIGAAVKAVDHDIDRLADVMQTALRKMDLETVKLIQTLDQMNRLPKEIAAAIRKSGTTTRQELITTRAAQDAASRANIAEIKNEGKIRYVEALNSGVAAKQAAQARMASHKAMMGQIIRIEKAIGAAAVGTAKVTVAAFSSVASGVSGVFRRLFSTTSSSMKQINREMTSGLDRSLTSRESAMRESFTRQERIIGRSAARQQTLIAGARTQTQTGVIGAANRGLNLGAFIGGAAVLMAVRSTFNVGSEFARGLAVLQAQLDLSGESMKAVRQTAIELGNDLTLPGVSALDAGEAIGLLSKQFASLGEGAIIAAQDAAKGTLQLSRAAGVGADEAAQVVGSAVNVFGIAADEATAVADQVTAALKNAAGVSFADFADSFKQGAAVFAQFQKPAVGATEALVGFNTALAVIARAGVVGSDAGTSLKQFFLQANRGTDEANAAMETLVSRAGEVGTAFYDAAGQARPFEQTLDILRRGLEGMSDEQRNATLQTLFGSDAIRVANALLGVSTEEYAKMTQAMREEGLAAKIAAAQNTGFKGALDALKSVVETLQIIFYEKVNPALGAFTLAIAGAANAIFFGDGAFEILRKALLGMAIGMTAVIAAKGAVEVLRLLGTAAKLALTPFGGLLVVAGLLGAAIAVLMDSSPEFAAAINDIGNALDPVARMVRGAVSSAFEFLGRVLSGSVVPALTDAAVWVAERVLPAFTAVKSFVTDSLIPAMKEAAGVIGKGMATAWGWATDQAERFWNFVEPIIRPAIDGFHELANAVGAVFSDWDFSQLRQGANDAIAGVVATAGTVLGMVGEALTPVVKSVFEFMRDLFSPENLKKYAAGFLTLVEEMGRILGLIVSDPVLYKVLAGVAAAVAIIAFRFVKGLGEGIVENLPELWALLKEALAAGFKLVFDNLGLVIMGAIVGIGLIRAFSGLKGLFSNEGAKAGAGFMSGFRGRVAGMGQFLSTLRAGSPQFSQLNSDAAAATAAQNQLRILGSSTKVSMDSASIAAAKNEALKLRAHLTDSQYAALKFRDNMMLARTAIGQVGAGVKGVSTGIGQMVSGLRGVFGSKGRLEGALPKIGFSAGQQQGLLSNARLMFAGMLDMIPSSGQFSKRFNDTFVVGAKVAAGNVRKAIEPVTSTLAGMGLAAERQTSRAFKGIGSFFSGVRDGAKQVGQIIAKDFPLGQMIRSSEGLRLGKIMVGGIASSFRSGASTISSSFATMMEGLRATAAQAGTTVGKAFGKALGGAAIAAAAAVGGFAAGKAEGSSGGSGLMSAILGGVGTGAMIGGPWGAAAGAVVAGASLIGAAFGRSEAAAKKLKEQVSSLTSALKSELTSAIEAGVIKLKDLKEGLDFADVLKLGDAVANAFETALGTDGVKALDALGLSFDENLRPILEGGGTLDQMKEAMTETMLGAAASSDEFRKRFGDNAGAVKAALADLFAPGGGSNYDDLIEAAMGGGNAQLTTDLSNNEAFIKNLIDTANDLTGATQTTSTTIDNLNASTSVFGTKAKDAAGAMGGWAGRFAAFDRAAERSTALDTVASALDAAAKRLENFKIKMLDLFVLPGDIPIQEQIDKALLDVDGLGGRIAEALGQGTEVGRASAREAMRGFGTDIETVIAAGVDQGLIVDANTARFLTQGIYDVAVAGLPTDSKAFADMTAAWENAINGVEPAINSLKVAATATDAYRATLDSVVPTISNVNVATTSTDAWRAAMYGALESNVKPVTFDTDTADAKAKGKDAGSNMGVGFVEGLRSQVQSVADAAAMLAKEAVRVAKYNLKISSPSRVFMDIGMNVGLGFAQGIEGAEGDVVSAMESAISKAVDAAKQGIDSAKATMSTLGAGLWAALTGSDAALNSTSSLSSARSAVTNAFQSVLTSWDSTVGMVFSAGAKEADQRTAADNVILNENDQGKLWTIDPTSVLGSANLSMITNAMDAIADYGEVLLAQGMSATDVASEMTKQTNELIWMLGGLGFSADELFALADSLGLSADALAAFIAQVDAAKAVASTPPPEPARQRLPGVGEIKNYIYLPTGDAQAAALAVANRQASWAFS